MEFFEESLLRQVHWFVNESAKSSSKNRFPTTPSSNIQDDDDGSNQPDDHDDLMSVSSLGGAGLTTPRDQSTEPKRVSVIEEKYSPELAVLDTDQISTHYRLFKTFEVTKLSSRIVLFQVSMIYLLFLMN